VTRAASDTAATFSDVRNLAALVAVRGTCCVSAVSERRCCRCHEANQQASRDNFETQERHASHSALSVPFDFRRNSRVNCASNRIRQTDSAGDSPAVPKSQHLLQGLATGQLACR
jgi:hypothetical protein